MPEVDPWLPTRLAREARVVAGERAVQRAATDSLAVLLTGLAGVYDPITGTLDQARMDANDPDWQAAVDDVLLPAVGGVFSDAWEEQVAEIAPTVTAAAPDDFRDVLDRAALSPDAATTEHLATVRNRLVGVADEVFDRVRAEVEAGRQLGEAIPAIAARIDKVLGPDQWAARALTIARTETIGAYNAGHLSGTTEMAEAFGIPGGEVVKEWLATADSRTRETHAEADGQQQLSSVPFDVGGYALDAPGDPAGPPEEVINCRCTLLFHMPGDPAYPTALSGAAAPKESTMTTEPVTLADDDDTPGGGGDDVPTDCQGREPDDDGYGEGCGPDCEGREPGDPDYLVGCESQEETTPEGESQPPPLPPAPASHHEHARAAQPPPLIMVGPEAGEMPADGPPFYGVLAPEGVQTGDGRGFREGSLRQRDLPLPLRVQVADAPGHDGSIRAGRIDSIWRDDSGPVTKIRYSGVWATDSDGNLTPAAEQASREVEQKVLRGVSVDLDDTTVEYVHPDTGEVLDEDALWDLPLMTEPEMWVTDGRISSAAACSIPAFQEAYIANGTFVEGQEEPGDGDGEIADLVASAVPWSLVAALLPVYAPQDFADPGLTEPTPLTVTEDGRVYGHLATWGTCHIGFDGTCITPPYSHTGYAYFATGSVDTDDGPVPVGQITLGTGHAAAQLGHRPAAAHYDDTGLAVCDVAAGEDASGIWVAGRVRPGVSAEQRLALAHGGALSGDWRRIGGNLELVAALAVNVPGFPIPRTRTAVQRGEQTALVASGIVAPLPATSLVDARIIARQVLAVLDRRGKVDRLARRMGRDRASRMAAAAARIERG